MSDVSESQRNSPTTTEQRSAQKVEYDLTDMQPWREYAVMLYNDEVHSEIEVVAQLVKALGCTLGRAHRLMMKAHKSGKATVAITTQEKAIRIAEVLRQIGLEVTVRQIN